MNDLAERALAGADVARRALIARPVPWLALLGLLAGGVVVWTGGRIGAAPGAVPINSWLGLLPDAGYRVDTVVPGLVMLAGIAVLAGCWLTVLAVVDHRRTSERALWLTGALWALPFAVGPPLLSTDVYSSVAHGLLARDGLNPFHHGPNALGADRLISAIDPVWRSTRATDGPLGLGLEHVFVTAAAGNAVAAVLLLRALALVSAVAIGRLAMELAGPRRAPALVVTALNPAVLLFVVSGAHLDGLFVALLLAAVVRGAQRRWIAAVVFACLAAGLKPVALIAVAAVLLAHAIGQRQRISWRIAGRDLAVAVPILVVSTLTIAYGLGWSANIDALTREHTPFAPSSLVSDLIGLIVSPATFDDLAIGGRITTVLAAVTVVGYLLATIRDRPLERTVGYGLLAAALLGPLLLPWYLLWGVLCLAPTAVRARRDWVLALSLVMCVLAPVGFTTRTGEVVSACGFAAIAAWLLPRLVIRERRRAAALRASDADRPVPVSAGV